MDPTIVVAECGCRFKVVSSLPVLETGSLQLVTICVPHSHARTKYLEESLGEPEFSRRARGVLGQREYVTDVGETL